MQYTNPYPPQPQSKKGLGGCAIAAIVVGSIIGFLVLLLIVVAIFAAGSPKKTGTAVPPTATSSEDATTPPPAETTQAPPVAEPIVLKGKGTDVTKPVALDGDFKISVKWKGNTSPLGGSGGTNFVVNRIGEGGLFDSLIVNEIAEHGSATSAMTGLSGKQTFEVDSHGSWTITITPL